MGVDSETLREEHLIAGSDDATVVEVDVVDEEPRADAVIRQFAPFLGQLHNILIEEQSHLVLRVGSEVMGGGIIEMAERSVVDFIEPALG